jgi:hypothetical protein
MILWYKGYSVQLEEPVAIVRITYPASENEITIRNLYILRFTNLYKRKSTN